MEESVQIDEILPLDIEEQLQATTPSPTPHTTTTTRTMATLGTPSVEREMRSNKKQTEMRDRDEKQQLNTPHNPAVEKKKETSMNKRDACVSSKQPSVSSTPTEPNRTTDKVKGTPIAFLPRIGANHWYEICHEMSVGLCVCVYVCLGLCVCVGVCHLHVCVIVGTLNLCPFTPYRTCHHDLSTFHAYGTMLQCICSQYRE